MKAVIRFYGEVGPRASNVKYWWPDIAWRYAIALRSLGLRMLALGGAQFQFYIPKAQQDPTIRHWQTLADEFVAELAPTFVNVVCAPVGLPLGTIRETKELGTVYTPDTALHGLLTVGVRNIAITAARREKFDGSVEPTEITPREVTALKQYDAVISPYEADVDTLGQAGVRAHCMSATSLHETAMHIPSIAEVVDA